MANYDPFAPNADRSIPVNTETPLRGPVILLPYDSKWAEMYESEAAIIREALGEKALVLEHVGSTSVPGLIAKPCIDITLGVAESAHEEAYAPELDAAGFVLRRREPDWHEHLVFKSERINVNLHVWTIGSIELGRHIAFRDWLRSHPEDRDDYADAKREIASGNFEHMNQYADAKDEIVRRILGKIEAAADTIG